MKIPGVAHFELEELVDKPFIDKFGGRAMGFLDLKLIACMDRLRVAVGPLSVNNWHRGGSFHESGLRVPDTKIGARFSPHKYGWAFDLKPDGMTVPELYNYIMQHAALFPEIRRIEDINYTPTWLHIDSFNHPGDGILIVKP